MFEILKQKLIKFNIKPDELDIWFHVKDKLPEDNAHVQVYLPDMIFMADYYNEHGFCTFDYRELEDKITHWRVCKNPHGEVVELYNSDDE